MSNESNEQAVGKVMGASPHNPDESAAVDWALAKRALDESNERLKKAQREHDRSRADLDHAIRAQAFAEVREDREREQLKTRLRAAQ